MRVFFGVFAPAEVIQSVIKMNAQLQRLSGKQVELENLHVTVIFLGEVNEDDLNRITQVAEKLSKDIEPFTITFDRVELLPNNTNPRILNYTISDEGKFSHLQAELAKLLVGININTVDYHQPHLTLMRLHEAVTSPLPKAKPVTSTVSEFSLIESRLTESGPIYKVIKTFVLGMKKNKTYRLSVAICLFDDESRVLLIKNSIFPGDHWQIPQGGIEPGETASAAAVRELGEETGINGAHLIKVSDNKFSHLYKNNPEENPYVGQEFTTVFLKVNGQPKITLDKSEASEFKWVKLDDVVNSVALSRQEYMKQVVSELEIILKQHD